ncbi:peptidase T [Oscillospiraceae bacterium HV4-5-C5C]|nr:peptidase T [Oscillospiraceae bacterium HV4-5-C5C]
MTEQDQLTTVEAKHAPQTDALTYFLRYIDVESTSDEARAEQHWPSSEGQLRLARLLQADLGRLGLTASLDENGYVMARIPSNLPPERPAGALKLGFIAHMDTAPDLTARNVRPRQVHYEGGDLVLNEEKGIVMKEALFPNLSRHRGEDLIVTDGQTLLGADDKAGVAALLALADTLQQNPDIPHGEICLAFTPDEEIGRGAHRFNLAAFGADVAYTVDGGPLGELEYANFNAAGAVVTVTGRNVHPGSAKGKLLNAALAARDYTLGFDRQDTPEHTAGREGFFHLLQFDGSVEKAVLQYIIRDFDRESFEARKQQMQRQAELLNQQLGETAVQVDIQDQYYNMEEQIRPHFYLVELAREAMRRCGVTPLEQPIRGGTDGAQLSFRGLPCPNLFTGGDNFHGRYEFLSLPEFRKLGDVLLCLVQLFAGWRPDQTAAAADTAEMRGQ